MKLVSSVLIDILSKQEEWEGAVHISQSETWIDISNSNEFSPKRKQLILKTRHTLRDRFLSIFNKLPAAVFPLPQTVNTQSLEIWNNSYGDNSPIYDESSLC